jgi:hypothetical protein
VFSSDLDFPVFMFNILTVMDIHTTWPDYFDLILLDYMLIVILLQNSFVPELHSHICRCPVELLLEWNILPYNVALSFKLNIWDLMDGLL